MNRKHYWCLGNQAIIFIIKKRMQQFLPISIHFNNVASKGGKLKSSNDPIKNHFSLYSNSLRIVLVTFHIWYILSAIQFLMGVSSISLVVLQLMVWPGLLGFLLFTKDIRHTFLEISSFGWTCNYDLPMLDFYCLRKEFFC